MLKQRLNLSSNSVNNTNAPDNDNNTTKDDTTTVNLSVSLKLDKDDNVVKVQEILLLPPQQKNIINKSYNFLHNLPLITIHIIQLVLSSFNNSTNSINTQNNIKNVNTGNNGNCKDNTNTGVHNDTNEKSNEKVSELRLFGINIGVFNNFVIFLILLFVVLTGFLLTGIVEENFKYAFPGFNFGWYMTSIELFVFTIFAVIERVYSFGIHNIWAQYQKNMKNKREKLLFANGNNNNENHTVVNINNNNNNNTNESNTKNNDNHKYENKNLFQLFYIVTFDRKVDLRYHLIVAISMTFSRALTNISLLLLNYPTQVVFKSMKLLSVMIGSRCFLKKQYSTLEYIAAPFMVASAILFSLGDSTSSLRFDLWGLIVVLVSLIFDSIHANAQEYTLRLHRDTTVELLVYSNLLSGVFSCIIGTMAGELIPLIKYIENHSILGMLKWFVIRSMCLYIGVAAFVVFTKKFGAVAAVTITTVRKVLTVLLSFVLWPTMKAFTSQHSVGTVVFMVSLILNAFGVVYK